MFWQLQYLGCADERFNYENFGFQPDWLIFQALQFFIENRQREANAAGLVHAIGWAGLFNGFSKDSASKIEPYRLLPYPEIAQRGQRRLSPKTTHILASLAEDGRLPKKILLLIQQFDEVAELIKDQ